MSGPQPQVHTSSQAPGANRGLGSGRERQGGSGLAQLLPSAGFHSHKGRIHEAGKARPHSPPASKQHRNPENGPGISRKVAERQNPLEDHRGISSEMEKDIFGDYAGSGTGGSSVGQPNISQKPRERTLIEFETVPAEDESAQGPTGQEDILVDKIEGFCAYQESLRRFTLSQSAASSTRSSLSKARKTRLRSQSRS